MSYRLFPATNGPGASTSFGGVLVQGILFKVTSPGMVLQGYWLWRADSSQSASASFALWQPTGFGTGTLISSSSASTSTMVAGQWNYVPLPTPLALTSGTAYKAVYGVSGNFPDTITQFDTGGPYVNGIINGPLTGFSAYAAAGGTLPDVYGDVQCSYDTSTSDPTAVYPANDNSSYNAWINVQVSFAAASDVPQVQPGPVWLRRFKPGLQRPVPPVPATPAVNASGGLALAPLAFAGHGAQTSPDTPAITPGPAWFRFFKPQWPKPVPPVPATQSVNATGGVALAPLAFAASGAQTSPDIPQIQPGPVWFRLFRPWVQRPAPVPPAVQSVNATGSLALAPLALSGQGAQTSPDAPQVQPGPVWLRLFRPLLAPKVPPPPAAPAVNATGGLALAPLALSGAVTVAGSPSSDQPQLQPGPVWLRLFKPWIQRPAPATAGQGSVTITAAGGITLAPLAMSGTVSTPSPLFAATGARWKWGTAGSWWKWGTGGARNQ